MWLYFHYYKYHSEAALLPIQNQLQNLLWKCKFCALWIFCPPKRKWFFLNSCWFKFNFYFNSHLLCTSSGVRMASDFYPKFESVWNSIRNKTRKKKPSPRYGFLVACTRLYNPLCPSVGWPHFTFFIAFISLSHF